MKELWVLQHTEAEYLGLMEDHLEGRNLRFRYLRPFAPGGMVPEHPGKAAGLVVLGGGPYGVVSGHLLPSLGAELRLVTRFLAAGLPVRGFGLGAVILSVAAGGGAEDAPLRFAVETAVPEGGGLLPMAFPLTLYLRDRPLLPPDAQVLARSQSGEVLAFAVRGNALGLLGHPGMKRGMAEDLIMEFAETPDDTLTGLSQLGRDQSAIAEALGPLMVALTTLHGWM
jgi:GMP synthase-like glutamine amidotransferase